VRMAVLYELLAGRTAPPPSVATHGGARSTPGSTEPLIGARARGADA
jgi:hypothetical protein